MLSFRYIAAGLAVALLAGCGFRPLHGTGSQGEAGAELAAIEIDVIQDRIGQQLRNRLVDIFAAGRVPGERRYHLTIELEESTQKLAVEPDQTATRANYKLVATYSLFARGGANPLFRSRRSVVSSYNILTSDFATLSAERDAKARAVREAGDAIRTSLAVYFSGRRPPPTPAAP